MSPLVNLMIYGAIAVFFLWFSGLSSERELTYDGLNIHSTRDTGRDTRSDSRRDTRFNAGSDTKSDTQSDSSVNKRYEEGTRTGDEGKVEELCGICLDSINPSEYFTLACRHYFHRKCLKLWLDEKESCPHCRRHLNATDVNRIRSTR